MGVVSDVNYIAEKVTVKFTDEDSFTTEVFDWEGLEPLNRDMENKDNERGHGREKNNNNEDN